MGGIGDPSTNFYDANNRMVETWAPKVYTNGVAVRPITVNEFDDGGNIMATTDANGREVQMEYDAFGRLTHTVDAVGNTIGFEYDANGNQIALIDGNTNRTVFVYDGLNRKTSTIYPGGTHEDAVYDLLGNRIERIDCNGAKTLYVYDSRNRLNDVTYQNGNVRDYEYDTVGNLTNVTETADANATVSYTYDELNRVSSETSVGVTHQYAYDLNGNRTNAVYGISGRSVAWEYDALNRITYIREGDHTTEYYYDLNSKPLWRAYPSKVWEARTFDGMGRLLTMTTTNMVNNGWFSMAYEYDLVGSALQMEQTSSNLVGQAQNATTTWGYDDRYRLTNETVAIVGGTTSVSSYTWDAADNRLSMIKSVDGILASTTVYTNNALNQITGYVAEAPDLATTNVVYQYDANGSRTNKSVTVAGDGDPGVTSYTYDEDNRLIAVAGGDDPGNPTHHFKYDYRSRRYQRGTPTESTYHIFDGGLSIQEYDDPTLRISDAGISEYDTNQDGQNSQPTSATVVEGRQGIRLEGNAWKKVPLPVTLNSGSVLEFEVKIENVGEIIAIGVDDDNQYDNPRRLFQLAGWQVATNIEQDYTGVAVGSWIPVSIPIGQYFSGSFSHITFVADDDANGQAAVSFRNISVRADSDPLPYSTLRTEFIRGEGMGGGVGGMVYSIKDDGNGNDDIICSHANHRGDVIARSDSAGSLTSFALYEAYGTRPYEWGDDPDRQKANTKEEEKDLDLLNEGMRYRDLETGTFINRDPIGYWDGPNMYCYVHCNPITHFDAYGLSDEEVDEEIDTMDGEEEAQEAEDSSVDEAATDVQPPETQENASAPSRADLAAEMKQKKSDGSISGTASEQQKKNEKQQQPGSPTPQQQQNRTDPSKYVPARITRPPENSALRQAEKNLEYTQNRDEARANRPNDEATKIMYPDTTTEKLVTVGNVVQSMAGLGLADNVFDAVDSGKGLVGGIGSVAEGAKEHQDYVDSLKLGSGDY